MIRITKIIPKNEFFELMKDANIGKLLIDTSKNKSIKNLELIKVSIYLRMQYTDWVCMNKKIATVAETHTFVNNDDKAFLRSLSKSFNVGYLRVRYIRQLLEIQKKEKVHFQIPKKLIKLVDEYDTK